MNLDYSTSAVYLFSSSRKEKFTRSGGNLNLKYLIALEFKIIPKLKTLKGARIILHYSKQTKRPYKIKQKQKTSCQSTYYAKV